MALERFYRLDPERQAQLLGSAAEAFAEGGYDGTSFNKLLERLGFSKSQAYYYFADKADLFATACASCYEQFYERVGQLPTPETAEAFWQYVLELNRVGFKFYDQNPMAARLARAAASSAHRDELLRAGVRNAGSTEQRYRDWLELGQRLGAVRRDLPNELLLPICVQLATSLDVWFSERAGRASASDIEALSRAATDLSWRLLHPDDASPPALAVGALPQPRQRTARQGSAPGHGPGARTSSSSPSSSPASGSARAPARKRRSKPSPAKKRST
jgi:AcrR family transcriptional regulator